MRRINLLFSIILLLAVTSSCSKEKRIERRLYSGEGKWLVTEQRSNTYLNGVEDEAQAVVYTDAGYMIFSKNGDFVWRRTLAGTIYDVGGSWLNAKDELDLIANGQTVIITIQKESRKKMELEYIITTESANGTSKTVNRLNIEKI